MYYLQVHLWIKIFIYFTVHLLFVLLCAKTNCWNLEDKSSSDNLGINDDAYLIHVHILKPKILPGESGVPCMSITVKIL